MFDAIDLTHFRNHDERNDTRKKKIERRQFTLFLSPFLFLSISISLSSCFGEKKEEEDEEDEESRVNPEVRRTGGKLGEAPLNRYPEFTRTDGRRLNS